jgi:hypothetical protein
VKRVRMYNIFFLFFRYEYDDPEFDKTRALTNIVASGAGPVSPSAFMPKFLVKLVNRKVCPLLFLLARTFIFNNPKVCCKKDMSSVNFLNDTTRRFIVCVFTLQKFMLTNRF